MSAGSDLPVSPPRPAPGPVSGSPLWLRILGLPKTQIGWWSVILVIGFILFVTLFQLLEASGQKGGATLLSNPLMAGTLIAAAVSAIAGAVFGLLAVLLKRERSLPVFVAALLGFFVLFFVLGEFGGHK
jgi:hypothetical protein